MISNLLNWDWVEHFDTTDANAAAASLKKAVLTALDATVPLRKFFPRKSPVCLAKDTRVVMRARDIAKREGAKHYKELRNRALSLIQRDFVSFNLERIRKEGQTAAWKITAETTGKGAGGALPLPAGCISDSAAANLCNNFYIEKVEKLRDGLGVRDTATNKTAEFSAPNHETFEFSCVGTAAVRKALFSLETKNATGVDGIPITVYKTAWSVLALPLVHLVNLVIRTGVWLDEWKLATIIPVLKAGKPRLEVSSYRPVSLLCAISKLVERVLYDQLAAYVEACGIIPNQQHGFRVGHGVDTALATMFNAAVKAMGHGRKVGLVTYDFSSAFDMVESSALQTKLAWAGTSTRTLLHNYMTGGRQRVRWNTSESGVNEVNYGVRQGSVLGPLLFVLLTADLPMKVCPPLRTTPLQAPPLQALSSEADSSVDIVQYADDDPVT